MKIGNRRLRTPNLSWLRPRKPQSKLGKLLLGLLPLALIAVGVFIFFNWPALLQRLDYWVHKPKPGNVALLPTTTKSASQIPVGGTAECGTKPIRYSADGNPELICDNYIYIPRIRVAAPIVYAKSTADEAINNDLLRGVVHYPGTAEPGQKGNVFLTGHSSYYWWVDSDYKTVFTLVPELVGGDEIVVYHKGIRYTYKVSEIKDVSATDVSVLRPTDQPVVTLSTCVPIGTSYQRRIVRANQVNPDPQFARPGSSGSVTPGRLPGVR